MGEPRPKCFIAMPIRTREAEAEEFGDPDHWVHVREALFVKAVDAAGYEPVIPEARGAWLIHDRIITNLIEADLVLCDMSALNSNVFFELGVRTSLNKPIALVWDGRSELSFDTSGINTHKYAVPLKYWSMEKEIENLARHLTDSAESCAGQNPLWRQFGLRITAQEPAASETPTDAKLDLILQNLPALERENRDLRERLDLERLMRHDAEEAAARMGVAYSRHDFPSARAIRENGPGLARDAIDRLLTKNNVESMMIVSDAERLIRVFLGPKALTDEGLLEALRDLASRYEVAVEFATFPGPPDGSKVSKSGRAVPKWRSDPS